MLRKICRELVRIRKELHTIRSSMESFQKPLTINEVNHQLAERLVKQERFFGPIKEDTEMVYEVINLFRQRELTIDRAFRVLEDTRSTLPRITKFAKIR